jgi:hypothetical protein
MTTAYKAANLFSPEVRVAFSLLANNVSKIFWFFKSNVSIGPMEDKIICPKNLVLLPNITEIHWEILEIKYTDEQMKNRGTIFTTCVQFIC